MTKDKTISSNPRIVYSIERVDFGYVIANIDAIVIAGCTKLDDALDVIERLIKKDQSITEAEEIIPVVPLKAAKEKAKPKPTETKASLRADVTPSEGKVLKHLMVCAKKADNKEVRIQMATLARHANVSLEAMTNILDHLELKKLVDLRIMEGYDPVITVNDYQPINQ